MANLKDIRTRINSVKSTRQVTSAMKMVSAAKFKKAQTNVENVRPFITKLMDMANMLGHSVEDLEHNSPAFAQPKKGKTVILALASNKGLAGAFNSNVVKEVERLVKEDYSAEYAAGNLEIHVVGKQVTKGLKARKVEVTAEYNDVLDSLQRQDVYAVVSKMFEGFKGGAYRKIVVVYNEFVNAAVQNVKGVQLLPMQLEMPKAEAEAKAKVALDFIVEPSKAEVLNDLMPQVVNTRFLAIFFESLASEHGARMTSMNKATDNATELLNDLQLQYNKARQGAITNELIEIVSGAEALNAK